ncbi:MAG TPA: efflux RND transporter periplasmic adaptor subunit [Polyangiaceae bacterium]|jgi:HlyD family secretion protein|nr:efflux RND transporter periplasmic adaptor subunit [Polyangiaceae bacterium]
MTDTIAATEELKKALSSEEGARRWVRRLAIALGVVAVVGGGLAWSSAHQPPPPARFTTAPVAVGDVLENVQATGTIQPLLEVNVGTQVSGRVTAVLVDYNSVVKKGDLLAEIDPLIYGTQVSAGQANLTSSRAQLEQAKASALSAKAQRDIAKVTADRTEKLFEQNLASRADLDTAKGNLEAANAQFEAATATVMSQDAAIGAQTAALRQSTANLGYTKIYSPVDGVVVTRGIDPGATVQSSFQVAVLFVIAQDLRNMRILADVDEADVGKIQDAMDTDCIVDAFPGDIFRGKISQVRFSPNNVSGVVTYSAVVDVDNPDVKLRPGMTTTITVHTHEAHGVPRIPNAALRYRPTPPMAADGKPIPQPPEAALPKGRARVWVQTSDKLGDEKDEMRIVSVGITDGIFTEVTDPALPVGTHVVTDEADLEGKKKSKVF